MTNFKFFLEILDNHYAIYVIHQNIQGQLLMYSLLHYFHQWSLHQIYHSFLI